MAQRLIILSESISLFQFLFQYLYNSYFLSVTYYLSTFMIQILLCITQYIVDNNHNSFIYQLSKLSTQLITFSSQYCLFLLIYGKDHIVSHTTVYNILLGVLRYLPNFTILISVLCIFTTAKQARSYLSRDLKKKSPKILK